MFTKIEEADLLNKGNVGMPDTPNLTTAEMQAKMDELSRDVIIPKLNNLIGELESQSAASNLGVEPPESFVSTTIQTLIAEIALIVLENQLKAHGHENKDSLDSITEQSMESWNKLVEVLGHITSVANNITDSTTDIPNSHAIVEYVSSLGAGDMLKALYDTNNSGVVDNAEQLGGETPDAFQRVFDELLNTMAKTIPGAINEVLRSLGDVSALKTDIKLDLVSAVNELKENAPEMLENMEEVEANNEPGKVVDALTVKEINNNLGGLRFGVDGEGNYGYLKGDDTFVPFKRGSNFEGVGVISGTRESNQSYVGAQIDSSLRDTCKYVTFKLNKAPSTQWLYVVDTNGTMSTRPWVSLGDNVYEYECAEGESFALHTKYNVTLMAGIGVLSDAISFVYCKFLPTKP